jgi:septum formation protein
MQPIYPVILASRSPRRAELLKKLIESFEVVPADIDENQSYRQPAELAEKLANAKADVVFKRCPNAIVIAADTVVALQERLLGKPEDVNEAIDFLKSLSGKQHKVTTGVAIRWPLQNATSFAVTSFVTFRELTEKQILEYANSEEPFDKAGGYAIQGQAAKFIENIEGDYENIIGLPIARLAEELTKLKLTRNG